MDYLTNDEELNAVLEKQVAALAPELKAVIDSDAIEVFARSTAEHFALIDEEEDALIHEIALIVMKIEPVDSLLGHLLTEALIPMERAERIVEDANKTVFAPIEKFLLQSNNPSPTAPVTPVIPSPTSTEKPYIETPVKKAAYGAILDVPNYTAPAPSTPPPAAPAAPKPVPFIPETPLVRVQPAFEAPQTSPRAPQRILPTENRASLTEND